MANPTVLPPTYGDGTIVLVTTETPPRTFVFPLATKPLDNTAGFKAIADAISALATATKPPDATAALTAIATAIKTQPVLLPGLTAISDAVKAMTVVMVTDDQKFLDMDAKFLPATTTTTPPTTTPPKVT